MFLQVRSLRDSFKRPIFSTQLRALSRVRLESLLSDHTGSIKLLPNRSSTLRFFRRSKVVRESTELRKTLLSHQRQTFLMITVLSQGSSRERNQWFLERKSSESSLAIKASSKLRNSCRNSRSREQSTEKVLLLENLPRKIIKLMNITKRMISLLKKLTKKKRRSRNILKQLLSNHMLRRSLLKKRLRKLLSHRRNMNYQKKSQLRSKLKRLKKSQLLLMSKSLKFQSPLDMLPTEQSLHTAERPLLLQRNPSRFCSRMARHITTALAASLRANHSVTAPTQQMAKASCPSNTLMREKTLKSQSVDASITSPKAASSVTAVTRLSQRKLTGDQL